MKNSHSYFENRDCEYFPCHDGLNQINCLFCYCPLYNIENCPGNPVYKEKDGRRIKVCTNCTFPHQKENYETIVEWIRKGIKHE